MVAAPIGQEEEDRGLGALLRASILVGDVEEDTGARS